MYRKLAPAKFLQYTAVGRHINTGRNGYGREPVLPKVGPDAGRTAKPHKGPDMCLVGISPSTGTCLVDISPSTGTCLVDISLSTGIGLVDISPSTGMSLVDISLSTGFVWFASVRQPECVWLATTHPPEDTEAQTNLTIT